MFDLVRTCAKSLLSRALPLALLTALISAPAVRAEEKPADVTASAIAALEKSDSQLVRVVLDNGMICLIKEDHSAPVASVQIWVGTGSIHEQEYLGSGLSHAIEHMIFKGTDKRSVGDITKEINDAGGDINAYTTLDRTVFHADLPSRNWRVGLDVLSDAVMHGTFPEKEWDKEKDVILRELAMNNDDPDRVLDKLSWSTCFAVHPYRYPVIGYAEVFKKLTQRDLLLFARRNYVPDNMMVVIVGDVNAKDVEAAIREVFAGLERKARAPVILPQEPLQISPRFARKTGPYKVSRLEWTYHSVPLNSPEMATLDVLAEILGSGDSSRLVQEIKEKQKLVHSISASSVTLRDAGVFDISATFDPLKEREVIAAIQKEVDSWANTTFSQDEIDKARRMLITSQLSELQTTRGEAGSYAIGEFCAQDPYFAETYLRLVGRVTPEMLQEAARKYFRPENRTLAILSPPLEAATNVEKQVSLMNVVPVKSVMSNGVPLIVREDHRLPFVYFCVSLRGGLLAEEDSNNGITRLMSSLLVKGTKNRSRQDIAKTVESLGGMLSPYSGYNGFGLEARCLSADAPTFMNLISDCLLNASFPDEEIEKQKVVQIAQYDQEHERPSVIAQEALREMLFPGHPYRWNLLGKKETVGKISRADLQAHLKKLAVSGNVAIAIFGDITPEQAGKLAGDGLASVPKAGNPLKPHEKPAPTLPTRKQQTEPKEQTVLFLGFPGVSVTDPRSDALAILQHAMSGLSADLAIEVRDKRGLAYYVGAQQQTGIEPGAFMFYAGTREDVVQEVEQLMRKEMDRILKKGLRKEEVDRAREQIIADFEMGLQDNLGSAMNCALDELYGLGYQHFFNARQRFEAVTAEDVQRAARTVLSEKLMAVSVVLPEHKDQPKKEDVHGK